MTIIRAQTEEWPTCGHGQCMRAARYLVSIPLHPALHPESAYACSEHPAEVLDRMTQLSKNGSVTVDRINAGTAQV